jgi:hypothetical protein
MFLMIFQNLMGPRKSRCEVLNGTTQGQDCPLPNFKFQFFFHFRVPIESFHVSRNVFYHLNSSYGAERCICRHVEILKIIDAHCHDPD